MSEVAAWLRLSQIEGMGPQTARKLLQTFGLPETIFNAGWDALTRVVSVKQAHAILSPPSEALLSLIKRTEEWCTQPNHAFITLADITYPAQLLAIPDPPIFLYVMGELNRLVEPSIAIVGSRHASAQGAHHAQAFAACLSEAGLSIISGLALGIDAAAHMGALEAFAAQNKGSTIAVIGTGIDVVYPARNRSLAHRIAESGCIVSEYPLGTPPIAHHFPRRNRLISGLSRGVLVVEAAIRSGSLVTARMALEQGRDVFAIPGSIHSPLSKGCHALIKQGAKLVETAEDILHELHIESVSPRIKPSEEALPDVPKKEAGLLSQIGHDPIHMEHLMALTGLSMHDLSGQLLTLELDGQVEVLPGGLYQRVSV